MPFCQAEHDCTILKTWLGMCQIERPQVEGNEECWNLIWILSAASSFGWLYDSFKEWNDITRNSFVYRINIEIHVPRRRRFFGIVFSLWMSSLSFVLRLRSNNRSIFGWMIRGCVWCMSTWKVFDAIVVKISRGGISKLMSLSKNRFIAFLSFILFLQMPFSLLCLSYL